MPQFLVLVRNFLVAPCRPTTRWNATRWSTRNQEHKILVSLNPVLNQ
jgi:hypothetical protein